MDALHTRVRRLENRDETVFAGRGPSISVRIQVSGHMTLVPILTVLLVAWLSTMEQTDTNEGFPQSSWTHHTSQAGEKCCQMCTTFH